jgi:hypothetical protein
MKNLHRPLWTAYNSRQLNSRQLAEKSEFYRLLDGLKADPTEDRVELALVDISFCVSIKLYRRISGDRPPTSCRIDTQLEIAT